MPPDLIGGKILWAHPDGYFLSAYGRKIKHDFSPSSQRGWTAARPSSGGNRGGCYPKMLHFGNKLCHHLMYEAFYGPRSKGMEIDHLNGNKLDYRPANLEQVTRAENYRRRSYLHILESVFTVVHHWQTFTPEDYHRFYAMPLDEFKALWQK